MQSRHASLEPVSHCLEIRTPVEDSNSIVLNR